MHIKILVLGITGNLAQLKIIPGIAQFSETLSSTSHTVELIGYSRSTMDYQTLVHQLNIHTKTGSHTLTSITLYNGEYTNNALYNSLIQELKEDEQLWIYLALPPDVYLPFLQITTVYPNKSVFILVEKPFGSDLKNTHSIKELIETRNLNKNVLFVDHYLFKAGLTLTPPYTISPTNISALSMYAYETVGVEERVGYYARIGAAKDMLPHLLSTLQFQLRAITQQYLSISDIDITDMVLGQYVHAPHGLPFTTPTYFYLAGILHVAGFSIPVTLGSGKKLNAKSTYSEIICEEGVIRWELAPQNAIITPKHTITSENITTDHERLFHDLLNKNYARFLTIEEAYQSVVMEEKVVRYANSMRSKLITYPQGIKPDQLRLS